MPQDPAERARTVYGKIYHPLFNVPLPTVAELRSQCTDTESIEVLDSACRLAALRCQSHKRAKEAVQDYSAEPFIGVSVGIGTSPDFVLCETDLIRALLACQHPFLVQALFGAPDEPMQPSDFFNSGVAHWKSTLDLCTLEEVPVAVSPAWARRWALLFLEHPEQTIGLNTWLLSVSDLLPPNFSNLMCSGLITDGESRAKMVMTFSKYLEDLPGPQLRSFPRTSPAYFDRHGLLCAANDLLGTSRGFFLVGPQEETLRSLLRAITSNVNYCNEYKALGPIQGNGGHYFSPESANLQDGSGASFRTFALTGNIPEGVGGRAWCFDANEVANKSLVSESLAFFRLLTEQGNDCKVRFVIMMTQDEWSTLVRKVPEVTQFPQLPVPGREEIDLVPTLLAELPTILDRHGSALSLGMLLNFLYQTFQSRPQFLATCAASDLVGLVDPARENLGLLNTSPFPEQHKTPFERLNSFSFPLTIRHRPVRTMDLVSGEFFARYIGNVPELDALIVLYESLATLKDTDPSARVLGTGPTGDVSILRSKARSPKTLENGSQVAGAESNRSGGSYVEVAKSLPKPTPEQTARFASFVADAHSWYKHLPLYPKTPFFFFLDPTAGMKFQPGLSGEGGTYVESLEGGIHYSDMPTAVYRKRFGHWNYHVDSGCKLLGRLLLEHLLHPRELRSIARCPDLGSNVKDVDGQKLSISPELMLTGKADLSALVHETTSPHLWIWDDVERLKGISPSTFLPTMEHAPSGLSELLRLVWTVLNTPNWYPMHDWQLLSQYQPYVNALAVDSKTPTRWSHEDRLMEKAQQLGGSHLYGAVLFSVEILRTIESRSQGLEIHKGSSPANEVKGLENHLVLERMQQLQAMKDAMNRFVEGLE
jgi:hypothetical protein